MSRQSKFSAVIAERNGVKKEFASVKMLAEKLEVTPTTVYNSIKYGKNLKGYEIRGVEKTYNL